MLHAESENACTQHVPIRVPFKISVTCEPIEVIRDFRRYARVDTGFTISDGSIFFNFVTGKLADQVAISSPPVRYFPTREPMQNMTNSNALVPRELT